MRPLKDNIDIFITSKAKLDSYFLKVQFVIKRYTPPFRYDINWACGGILIFIRVDTPAGMTNTASSTNFTGFL